MPLTLSSKLCTANDQFKKPLQFSNRLPFEISIDEHIKGGPSYWIQMEGISIDPWPNKPVMITCNLCEVQPAGKDFVNMLSMVYGKEKFTQPKVPALLGIKQEIMIEVKTFDNVNVDTNSVTLQLSLLPIE